MGFATPGSSAVGDTATAGTALSVPRSDHKHGREAFATTSDIADIAATEAAGTAATVPHGDHVHALPGLAAWSVFSPGFTNVTLGTGSVTDAKYALFGKTVLFRIALTLGTGGAPTGTVTITGLPVTSAAGVNLPIAASYFDSSASKYYSGMGRVVNAGTNVIPMAFDAVGVGGVTNVNATNPFTWAVGDIMVVAGAYETT